jgi:hypothetical protein
LKFYQRHTNEFLEKKRNPWKQIKEKESNKKSYSRRPIFRSVEVKKLAVTLGAIFHLFWDHEIHKAALATSHNQDMVFFL